MKISAKGIGFVGLPILLFGCLVECIFVCSAGAALVIALVGMAVILRMRQESNQPSKLRVVSTITPVDASKLVPGLALVHIVPVAAADNVLWSPDGRELFFRSGGAVMMVPVRSGPTFRFAKQRTLFRGNYFAIEGHNYQTFEISPDGKRFLMMKIVR